MGTNYATTLLSAKVLYITETPLALSGKSNLHILTYIIASRVVTLVLRD